MSHAIQFKPYTIQADGKSALASKPLTMILNLVTQYKIVLLRGFKSLDRDNLLNYCQSQARLLSWDFGPVMEMKVDEKPKTIYLLKEMFPYIGMALFIKSHVSYYFIVCRHPI